jgi:hypothetical protein
MNYFTYVVVVVDYGLLLRSQTDMRSPVQESIKAYVTNDINESRHFVLSTPQDFKTYFKLVFMDVPYEDVTGYRPKTC